VPAASRNLGETCSGHLNCVSGNCVPLCEDPKKESRCIEPRWSFTMYDLPVPSCIDSDTTMSFLKLGDDKSTFESFLAGKQSKSGTIHSILDVRDNIKAINAFTIARKTPQQHKHEVKPSNKIPKLQHNAASSATEPCDLCDPAPPISKAPVAAKSKPEKKVNVPKLRKVNEKKPAIENSNQEQKNAAPPNQGKNKKADPKSADDKVVSSVEDVVKKISQQQKTETSVSDNDKKNSNNKPKSEEVDKDLEDIKLEAEGLEFLRQIDLKAMQSQADVMKELRRDSPKKGLVYLLFSCINSLTMAFVNFFDRIKWW